MPHDVFISYSTKDKAAADAVCAGLEAAGLRCWIAPRDIRAGEDWPSAIVAAIAASRLMVLIFSASSNTSPEVPKEVNLALRSKVSVVPFRIEDVLPQGALDYYLAGTHWLDALDGATEQNLKQLVATVRKLVPTPAPTSDVEGISTTAPRLTNLPAQLTRFIGREHELAEVMRLLGKTRLLTLVGAGGCGKTRLANQVGSSFVESHADHPAGTDYPDGVWLVELAPIADAALVPRTVAGVFRITDDPVRTPTEQLVNLLQQKHLLLIIDNCEHVITACAEVIETLLSRCPRLTILATCREALRVPGEVAWNVPSLSTPDTLRLPPLPQVLEYESVELFITCASAVEPGFSLTPNNVTAIAQICRRLDGIPLAIEMAAAQVSALSVGEIAVGMDDMFALLSSGKRTALARQQTMQATLDWSYALLSLPERVLLARLGVFAGGWTAEAAKVVCGPASFPLLLKLVHKSLVVASRGHETTRYHLLEPVRQYAAAKLHEWGDDEVLATGERHWAYYEAMAEAEEQDDRRLENAWVQRLDAEHDNLRAAFDYARTRAGDDRGERMLRLARAVANYLMHGGYTEEGLAWLQEALERSPDGPLPARARALEAHANSHLHNGNFREEFRSVDASLALFAQFDDPDNMGNALQHRGILATYLEGEPQRAVGYLESALEQHKRAESSHGIAIDQGLMGFCWARLGETDKARSALEESFRLYESTGDFNYAGINLRLLAHMDRPNAMQLFDYALSGLKKPGDWEGHTRLLEWLAVTLMDEGSNERAASQLHECLSLMQHAGGSLLLRMTQAEVKLVLGVIEYRLGHIDSALRQHEEALRAANEIGFSPGLRTALNYFLAWFILSNDDHVLAEHYSREGMFYTRDTGYTELIALQLAQQSELAYRRGNLPRAVRLAGAAAVFEGRLSTSMLIWDIFWPAPWVEYQQVLAHIRPLTHDSGLAAAWAEGESMTLDQAHEYALKENETDTPALQ